MENYLHNKGIKLIAKCFSCWRQRHANRLEMQELAYEIGQQRDLELVHGIFTHWRDRFRFLESFKSKAEEHCRSRLIRYAF